MEKFRFFYTYMSRVNYAYLAVIALLVKALVSAVSYPDFLITIPILAFEGYKIYIKSRKPDPVAINAEIRKELDNLKSKVNAGNLEKNVIPGPTKRYF